MQHWLGSWGLTWGWLAGLLLLTGDLFLPVPGTAVMSGLGYLYGTAAGGFAATAGSFLSGSLAYWLCRTRGHRMAARLMGPDGMSRGKNLFHSRRGGFMVALSRCLPLLPEVIACMAGVTGMPAGKFHLALACGSLPMGFLFAWIGATGKDAPGMALGLSLVIPAVLYGLALLVMKRHGRS